MKRVCYTIFFYFVRIFEIPSCCNCVVDIERRLKAGCVQLIETSKNIALMMGLSTLLGFECFNRMREIISILKVLKYAF